MPTTLSRGHFLAPSETVEHLLNQITRAPPAMLGFERRVVFQFMDGGEHLMVRVVLLFLLVLLLPMPVAEGQASRPTTKPTVFEDRLTSVLERLGSDEFAGRSHTNIEKSRKLITEEFKRAGLVPVGPTMRQKFARSGLRGVNLVGLKSAKHKNRLPGHVIVSAHYDHLGSRGGKIYNGACDNASGVAAMIDMASRLKPEDLQRDVLFIAFDLEERGLLGSFAYAERPLIALTECKFFVTMDMLGRKGLGVLDNQMFVEGWEWTPEVLPMLQEESKRQELGFNFFWTDVSGDRSDFVAFRKKRIPHLFFSVGENKDYHSPQDDVAKIDQELLKRQARTISRVVARLANVEKPHAYRQVPDLNMIEFTSLKNMATLLATSSNANVTKETRKQAMILSSFADNVIRRGKVTSKDRGQLRRITGAMQKSFR
ncbi:MAG: hypothetical protein ACI97A_001070 [Planctomycetota bacterium]|jgi:hypothetical protein